MSLRVIKKEASILLRKISCLWFEARLFSFYNRTLIETTFLILYTLEQGLLIVFTEFVAEAEST